MKFSEIEEGQWPELKPYLDTVLLPITGLSGAEEPWEATYKLEQMRDLIDAVEEPFRGRVVIYPAYHYISESSFEQSFVDQVQHICSRLRVSGFKYVLIALRGNTTQLLDKPWCDFIISYSDYKGSTVAEMKKDVRRKIVALWDKSREDANM